LIYIKSTLAGLLAAMAVYLFVVAIGASVLIIASIMTKKRDSGIGFDIVAFGRSPLGRVIVVLALSPDLHGST